MLLQVSIRTFCDTFGSSNKQADMEKYIAEEMNEDKLTEELKDQNNLFLLAWYNEEMAGYAKIRANKEPQELSNHNPVEIERIYVLQKYHGKKIGAALMQQCITYAIDHGHDLVWLGVWEHNHSAVNFYKRWGFELFGEHPFILGNDIQTDVLMKKKLQK